MPVERRIPFEHVNEVIADLEGMIRTLKAYKDIVESRYLADDDLFLTILEDSENPVQAASNPYHWGNIITSWRILNRLLHKWQKGIRETYNDMIENMED